jgi:hypothetical protein
MGKKALLFEKRSKNFCYGGSRKLEPVNANPRSKSFLVLFFKKELLSLPVFAESGTPHE